MRFSRRAFLASAGAAVALPQFSVVAFAGREDLAQEVLGLWYRLTLELIRHTPTMTPPVASRALAYAGIACFEVRAGHDDRLRSLSGQLEDFRSVPRWSGSLPPDDAAALDAALGVLIADLFANTGPTGQHALKTMTQRMAVRVADGLDDATLSASRGYGAAVAASVLAWSQTDGGAVIENMGFPRAYTPVAGAGHWVPTSKIVLQQAPLLPGWGKNRCFAVAAGAMPEIAGPTPYSEDSSSRFYAEALETYDAVKNLTPEQEYIARFWADEAMLSYTPAGHWTAILNQVAAERAWDLTRHVEALARIGIAMADAFICCWAAKYRFNTVRPVTYIQKFIDPAWQPRLNTPPFPEYPSGHSVQSAAAAAVLTALCGENYAFRDESPTPDGVPPRAFASFSAAAGEAAISRLYGGIHFRPAIAHGQELGRAVAAQTIALRTRA